MKAEIKVLHVTHKTTKDQKPYALVHVLIVIDGVEFVRKFYLF